MLSVRFLTQILQNSVDVIRNDEQKKSYLKEQIANFVYEFSLDLYNRPGNINPHSEIICYMFHMTCRQNYTYQNIETSDQEVHRNNLMNLSMEISNDMVDFYLSNDLPYGAPLPPQNQEENMVHNFIENIYNNMLSI